MSDAPAQSGLDADQFSAKVTGLVASFGDPTRRGVFLYLREHPGATANDLAEHCGVHANVVRHHLDRLMASGYVTCGDVRRSRVGRPSKAYRVIDEDLSLDAMPRRNALLVALLERALEMLGPLATEEMALEVGKQYGHHLAETISPTDCNVSARAAMVVVADVMTAHGFAARAEEVATGTSVVSQCCPFGDAAQQHPVLCAVDRGLISGILEGIGAKTTEVKLTSRALGADACRATT